MLLVPTDLIQPGMVLAQPVHHPARDDLVLLHAQYELDAQMSRELQQQGVQYVWIEVPGLEEVGESVSPFVARGHTDLLRVLDRSINTLEHRIEVKVNVEHYQHAVHEMLTRIVQEPSHQVVTQHLSACAPMLAGHLANCSYLALLIGAHLSGYLISQRPAVPPSLADNTTQLGLGALLHDIGKVYMPDDLQSVSVLDSESEWPEYRFHVQTGYEEVREHVSPVAANIVLHHHERFDGKGFPGRQRNDRSEPLGGTDIHVFSRIVAVVDAFDHLLCPSGKAVPTVQAIHSLRQRRFSGWFDPVVVEALLRLVPPFMVGSVVTLEDGSDAAVVTNHPEAPCKPTVRLLGAPLAAGAREATGRQIDLRMSRGNQIAVVDGHDVRNFLYDGEFESRAA
ncbi:MAG: HD domain-containing phosphohydrolase [Planctomycetota bacterium]